MIIKHYVDDKLKSFLVNQLFFELIDNQKEANAKINGANDVLKILDIIYLSQEYDQFYHEIKLKLVMFLFENDNKKDNKQQDFEKRLKLILPSVKALLKILKESKTVDEKHRIYLVATIIKYYKNNSNVDSKIENEIKGLLSNEMSIEKYFNQSLEKYDYEVILDINEIMRFFYSKEELAKNA